MYTAVYADAVSAGLRETSGDEVSERAGAYTAVYALLSRRHVSGVVLSHRSLTGLTGVRRPCCSSFLSLITIRGVLRIELQTLGSVPRRSKKPRRLVADGRVCMWTMHHGHGRDGDGRSVDCRRTLALSPTVGQHRRLSAHRLADCPGRYAPGRPSLALATWALPGASPLLSS